jgi:hypothetical protein
LINKGLIKNKVKDEGKIAKINKRPNWTLERLNWLNQGLNWKINKVWKLF